MAETYLGSLLILTVVLGPTAVEVALRFTACRCSMPLLRASMQEWNVEVQLLASARARQYVLLLTGLLRARRPALLLPLCPLRPLPTGPPMAAHTGARARLEKSPDAIAAFLKYSMGMLYPNAAVIVE